MIISWNELKVISNISDNYLTSVEVNISVNDSLLYQLIIYKK